jgi:uncharacterized membrane protein YidH (DUF202 family)
MNVRAGLPDRGAQLERTTLSWNRVAISLAANGVLLLRAGFVHNIVVLEAFGATIALAGLALWALSLLRYSKLAGSPVQHLFGRRQGAVPTLARFIIVLSLVDLAVVVFAR